jgi:hypothetical protein
MHGSATVYRFTCQNEVGKDVFSEGRVVKIMCQLCPKAQTYACLLILDSS